MEVFQLLWVLDLEDGFGCVSESAGGRHRIHLVSLSRSTEELDCAVRLHVDDGALHAFTLGLLCTFG